MTDCGALQQVPESVGPQQARQQGHHDVELRGRQICPGQSVSGQGLQSKPFVVTAAAARYGPGSPLDTHLEVCRQASIHGRTVTFPGIGREVAGVVSNSVPHGGTWWRVSARLAGPGQPVRRGRPARPTAAPRMFRMPATVVTTRHTPVHPQWRGNGRVTPNVDQQMQNGSGPVDRLGEAGRGHSGRGPVEGSRADAEHPNPEEEGADVIRVPVPSADDTAPRRGASSHRLLPLRRGVRAVRTQNIPVRASGLRGPG